MHRINTLLAIAALLATAGILPTASAATEGEASVETTATDPPTCEVTILVDKSFAKTPISVDLGEACTAPLQQVQDAVMSAMIGETRAFYWMPSTGVAGESTCEVIITGHSSDFPFFYVIIREECLIGPSMNGPGVTGDWWWRWQY